MKKITAILLLAIQGVSAQNSSLRSIAKEIVNDKDGQATYVELKDPAAVAEAEIPAFLNTMIFGESDNRVLLKHTETDGLGYRHQRFSIVQNGIAISGKMIVAHIRNGFLTSFNGDLKEFSGPVNGFNMSASAGLAKALQKVNAQSYMWQNEAMVAHMRATLNDPAFSYEPVAQKVLLEKDGRLYSAYCFNIYAEVPLSRNNVFVDATSGEILAMQNLLCTVDVPGTALTKYSGTQTIICQQTTSNIYELRDFTRGLGVETFNLNNTQNYTGAPTLTNATAAWTATNNNQGATDAHWGAEKTYDYYFTQHNRNSINNAGQKLLSYIHYNTNYSNAFWDGTRMTYGDGNGGSLKIFTTLDICGHEITHGLTDNTANLVYSNESGALNESFSDIFGICIENYARPSNWNWKMGEDMTVSNNGLRNMANPNQFQDPDTYLGNYWYSGTADNGGVHTNSSVGNYWFYLLTTGGAGVNDISQAYSVQGIGMNSAARIAYRALTVYFTPNTNYANARALTVQAAIDLFGQCSNEMIQTMNAWHAVGVGNKYVATALLPNFSGDVLSFCNLPATVNFNNTSGFGLSYSWNFGDGGTSTATNVAHTYTSSGNFTVKLKVTGCNSASDSISKNAYVSINVPQTPVVGNVVGCMNKPAVLNVTAPDAVKWFSDAAGTNLVGSGSSFTSSALSANTTFYVANTYPSTPAFGGMPSNTGGTYLNNSQQWLVFNVVQSCTLNTVTMYANSAGTRTIEFRNSANATYQSIPVTLTVGINVVPLVQPLSVGNNYRLALANGLADLYRSNTGVSYPYNIGGAVSIVNSSAGTGFYYWFYNWEVIREDCSSPLVPVNVQLNPVPSVNMNVSSDNVCTDDVVSLSGNPSGGVFTGNGVSGNTFVGNSMSAGIQTVTYVYTDPNGCSNSDSKVLVTNECTGMLRIAGWEKVSIYPNPASSKFTLSSLPDHTWIRVSDVSGRELKNFEAVSDRLDVPTADWTKGIYFVTLSTSGQSSAVFKLVKE